MFGSARLPLSIVAAGWVGVHAPVAATQQTVLPVFEPVQGQLVGSFPSQVYLQPSDPASPVRRGRVVEFWASVVPGTSDLQNWSVTSYAYVRVPIDRAGNLSRDSADLPFIEINGLSDADVLSLVAFVRGCPCVPESAVNAGFMTTVDGTHPIGTVRRGPDGIVEVGVRRDRSSGWILTLRRSGDIWRLLRVGITIA